jgi:hypothetical protein
LQEAGPLFLSGGRPSLSSATPVLLQRSPLSFFHNSPAFMKPCMCGERERTLPTRTISRQTRLTTQMLNHRRPFQVLEQGFSVLRGGEELGLGRAQRIVVTAVDSLLHRVSLRCHTLSPKKKIPPTSVLWYKPMAWLGVIRAHRRDEGWSGVLSQEAGLAFSPRRSLHSLGLRCGDDGHGGYVTLGP